MHPTPAQNVPDTHCVGQIGEPTPAEMYSALARELRSPLSTVTGYLELLATDGVGTVTEAQRDFLQVICRNVHRLTLVVDDWLELARLESGKATIIRQPIDLSSIVTSVVEEAREAIESKQQHLAVELPAEPVRVLADARSACRIVSNLFSNAHKYTQPGGTIRLVVGFDSDDSVRFDVIDSGIGIREEDQALLFRKFFRAPLTESAPGTGLGLTLTRLLVDRLGGTLAVQSALGKGSTFTVRLPRAIGVAGSAGHVAPAAAAHTDVDAEACVSTRP
jgi:signal transduction histidine kinase